ncbi:NLR family CARD domain-containing protein 4-like [Antedon mediterranea]|uniref:NLR family CARD domain-containing protein 4-like n=1 Tax=Antedon mediterranea TaxID=105859 RepID=UPI003AF4671A
MATDFDVDLVNFSEWYDKNNLVRQLKVLYHDLISVADIDKANTTIDLLNALRKTGRLSPGNLELLYETIKVTQTFGAIKVFQQSIFEVQEIQIINFTPYRHWIADFGNELRKAAVKKIDALFNNPLKNYEDSWSMIIDLEQRQILCGERKEEFINKLNKIGLASTMKCLTQVNVPNTSKTEQGTQKEFKSETGDVSTNSNKEQETQNKVESETEKIETYLIQIQKDKCSQASTFTPAIMNDRYKVDISQMFTDMELLTESENNKETSKPTTLEEVIDVISSKPGCRALIEGEGGIGKTTILRHLSYTWATNGPNQYTNGPNQSNNVFKGKIVFLLYLRDLEKDADIFDLIIKQLDMTDFNVKTDLPNDSRLIRKFIKKHDTKVVLLLDGLDELRVNNQIVISLFRKDNFKNSTVILTSRPENIDKCIKECNVHVRVKGFNKKSIGKYIDKHFTYFGRPALGESLRIELDIDTYPVGRKHPEAYSMCKNPMLLLTICMLWEDNQNLPSDNTALFKQLFRSILNQFNKIENCQKITKFENIPAEYVNSMILLGKCMYANLKVNKLSITKQDLTDKHSNTNIVDLALKLGFVYKEAPLSKFNCERIFMPLHKLIVESLVGFYLSKLFESENIKDECSDVRQLLIPLGDDELDEIKSEYFNVARHFALGFLDAATVGYYLKQYITKHFPLRMRSRIRKFFFGIKITDKERFIANILDIKPFEPYRYVGVSIRNVSRDVFNNFLTEFSHEQVQLALEYLDISGNNLHNIDVNSMSSLLIMCPKLRLLDMSHCNLSGDVINHLGTECSLKQVQLALRSLRISGNNFHNIDVNSLSSLLIMCPKLDWLDMRHCSLLGEVINYLTEECSNRGINFYTVYI